jgi:hypothetical protein
MHSHPESVSVFLNDCKAKFTYPDGRSEQIEAKAGQVMRMEAFEHDPENLGDAFDKSRLSSRSNQQREAGSPPSCSLRVELL